MKIKFYLPIEPFSVNRMYYRDRRHKSQDYRDWELAVVQAMSSKHVQQELAKLRDKFDAGQHGFVVRFDAQYPKQVLFNKQGQISSRAEDLTNWEKPLLDLLFLPKTHVQPAPYGCPNLNCDDKHVLRLVSSKSVSKDANHYIMVQIALISLKRPKED